MQDFSLWRKEETTETRHRYRIENAYSGQEFVSITGVVTAVGSGGGGDKSEIPPFQVTVPAIDIDWDGHTGWNDENDEDKRTLIVPYNDFRKFIVHEPREKDDLMGLPMPERLPDLRLSWSAGLLVHRNQASPPLNGNHFDIKSSKWTGGWPIVFWAKSDPNKTPADGKLKIRLERVNTEKPGEKATKWDVDMQVSWDEIHAARLELWDIVNGARQLVGYDKFTYISAAPQMPPLVALLRPNDLPGDVKWRLRVRYLRPNRGTYTGDVEYFPGPAENNWVVRPASGEWNIGVAFGTKIRGGEATLYYEYQGTTYEHRFHIRGTDPEPAAIKAYLDANGPWFAYCIAKHESGGPYLQFNTKGTLGPNANDYLRCPNRGPGSPYGWGIMQLDNIAVPGPGWRQPDGGEAWAQELWSWKDNCDTGIKVIARKKVEAATYLNKLAEANNANGYVMPPDIQVSGVWFRRNDPQRTPDQLETIKRYNGWTFWRTYDKEFDEWTSVLDDPSEKKPDYTEKVMNEYEN